MKYGLLQENGKEADSIQIRNKERIMAQNIRMFNRFMDSHVNLNKTRLDRLNNHVDAVKAYLRESNLRIKNIYPQGSYAHRTIIKPAKKNKEFDVDIIVQIEQNNNWHAKEYIENIYTIFKNNPTYKNKVCLGSRCVTLNYAGDFHLDVVPMVRTDGFWKWLWFGEEYQITNRHTNMGELTNSFGYNEWLNKKNDIISNNYFIDSIKLIKYLRDYKQNFSVKSILLNTILGNLISSKDKGSPEFKNLPTAFKTILNRLNDWLEKNPQMPIVKNPSLEKENFNRHWDEIKYQNFRKKIALYTRWINEAYNADNKSSKQKWQRIFEKIGQ